MAAWEHGRLGCSTACVKTAECWHADSYLILTIIVCYICYIILYYTRLYYSILYYIRNVLYYISYYLQGADAEVEAGLLRGKRIATFPVDLTGNI